MALPRSITDDRQDRCIQLIEAHLHTTENLIDSQLTSEATTSLNEAAFGLRELERLYRRRRGGPRRALALRMHYYSVWLRALVGRNELAKGHDIGARMLRKAHIHAIRLVADYPDSSEYASLFAKVKQWQP